MGKESKWAYVESSEERRELTTFAKLPAGTSLNSIDMGLDSAVGPDAAYTQFLEDNNTKTDCMDTAEIEIDRPSQRLIGPTEDVHTIESDRAGIFDEMLEQIGSKQVSRSKLQWAP